jgi:hypothetical protein
MSIPMKKRPVAELPAFSIPAGQHPEPDRIDEDGIDVARPWQERAEATFKGQDLIALFAPTGSGKTRWMKAHIAGRQMDAPDLRAVIMVPERSNMRSFDAGALKIRGRVVRFDAALRLDDGGRCVDRLIAFVRTKPSRGASQAERTVVCSRQAVVLAHQRMMAETPEGESPWTGILAFVDEVHHSQADDGLEDDAPLRNKLGHFLLHYLDRRPGPLAMSTATMMRSDRLDVVPRARFDELTRFVLPFHEHLETMTYLKRVRMAYLVCTPEEGLRAVLSSGLRKGLVWVPPVQSEHVAKHGDKYDALEQYLDVIGKPVAVDDWTETRWHRPRRGKAFDVQILDLVTEEGRRDRELAFDAAARAKGPTPDLLIALNKLREGFDWPEAAFGLALSEVRSIGDIVGSGLIRPGGPSN